MKKDGNEALVSSRGLSSLASKSPTLELYYTLQSEWEWGQESQESPQLRSLIFGACVYEYRNVIFFNSTYCTTYRQNQQDLIFHSQCLSTQPHQIGVSLFCVYIVKSTRIHSNPCATQSASESSFRPLPPLDLVRPSIPEYFAARCGLQHRSASSGTLWSLRSIVKVRGGGFCLCLTNLAAH